MPSLFILIEFIYIISFGLSTDYVCILAITRSYCRIHAFKLPSQAFHPSIYLLQCIWQVIVTARSRCLLCGQTKPDRMCIHMTVNAISCGQTRNMDDVDDGWHTHNKLHLYIYLGGAAVPRIGFGNHHTLGKPRMQRTLNLHIYIYFVLCVCKILAHWLFVIPHRQTMTHFWDLCLMNKWQ